ncbi:MAG: NUDIX domain-containing protein [Bacteroidota bacterium]
MPTLAVRVVDVYPYCLTGAEPAFLLLRRALGVRYAGQWRMVGGKIEEGEAAHETARRELREETSLVPRRMWTVPSVNTFYEAAADRVTIAPAFAAEVDRDPVLDDPTGAEHDAFAWLAPEEAAARLVWPEQQRLLLLCADLLRRNAVLDEWAVPA